MAQKPFAHSGSLVAHHPQPQWVLIGFGTTPCLAQHPRISDVSRRLIDGSSITLGELAIEKLEILAQPVELAQVPLDGGPLVCRPSQLRPSRPNKSACGHGGMRCACRMACTSLEPQNITRNRNFRVEGAFVQGPHGTGAKRKRKGDAV
jgi:hypothetical protein